MPSVRTMMYAASSVALLFTACSKAKDENPISGLYVSANVVMYDSVKMYTKSGVITDTTMIRDALGRRWDNVTFNFKAGIDSVQKSMAKIKVDPEGGDNYLDFTAYKRGYDIVSFANGLLVMLTKDSLTETSEGIPYYPITDVLDCGSSGYLIRKYQNSYGFGSDGANTYYRRSKRYAFLEESAGHVTYPCINYMFTQHSYGRSVCIAAGRDINNIFNEEFPAKLGYEDTLIVQISRTQMIKQ
ncbi:hypothetical protein L3C95_24025 [Chitinophaga filiformis]|uniref:hypothetical protein n=1 Tax=Chitinophaga filiformis TaxID=104663 RepID=UPI001F2488E0|nr:hypothetical protein [Chitinophaga filiformis]MCF6405990.1 hypothetical protein [Chitinophaga filiformis]